MSDNGFEPKIIAFLCNWCTYTGADLAGTSRLQYPPNVRIIRLMCSGAVDPIYVLKAGLQGADGVLIGGCHPGDCHYQEGNYKARRRVVLMKEIINYQGHIGYELCSPVLTNHSYEGLEYAKDQAALAVRFMRQCMEAAGYQ